MARHEYQVISDTPPARQILHSERDAVRAARNMLRRAERGGARTYTLESSSEPGQARQGGSEDLLATVQQRLNRHRSRASTHHIRNIDGTPVRITVSHIPDAAR